MVLFVIKSVRFALRHTFTAWCYNLNIFLNNTQWIVYFIFLFELNNSNKFTFFNK